MGDSDLPVLPFEYTEGDELPGLVVAFDFDISAFTEIAAAVERPDDTGFVRIAAVLNANQVSLTWAPTDWIAGCSQLTMRLTDSSGFVRHEDPIIVPVRPKPKAPAP